jgi:hypothetical protein
MDPIATYSEVRFDGTRTFMLFPDRIYIRGKKTLRSDFETEIPLTSFEPRYYQLNIRNGAFMGGLAMAVLSFVGCDILVAGLKMTFAQDAPVMMAGFGVSGLILAAATYRKVEYLVFKNQAGGTVMDIARSGKQAAQLDSFIDTLTKQIKSAKRAA